MSRKVTFSKNWHKAKRSVQKIHTRVKNARKDYLHKATTEISKNHAMVAIEDLQVGNLSKSRKGTTEAPGKNVAAKSGLNKAILDQGWFEFRRQLDYKLAWNGGRLITVPPRKHPERARAAAMYLRTTARRRRSFCVSNAASRRTPIWSARSMF